MADLIEPDPANGLSMNISLSGTNVFQTGRRVSPYTIYREGDGAFGLWSFPELWSNGVHVERAIRDLMDVKHTNLFRREYARKLTSTLDSRETFIGAIRSAPQFETQFSNNYFSRSLRQIARVIAGRKMLGQSRQTFYVQVGGWDHHDGLIDYQAWMLPWISQGLSEFRSVLKEIGEFENVTTFTISDFGRTLTSNGKGSDHGWGGHHMVMGGGVRGRDMYGTYPELSESSPLDVGRGVYIPTTAVEQYFGELALWFGVAPSELDEVLPGIRTFHSPETGGAPMGFMA